jgi:hypothetical protein
LQIRTSWPFKLAAYGADPMDRDVRVIGNDNVVAGVRDVLVID